jgi:hypothetical protein
MGETTEEPMRFVLSTIVVLGGLTAGNGSVQALTAPFGGHSLGGVDLNAYCNATYGTTSGGVALDNGVSSGHIPPYTGYDWVCIVNSVGEFRGQTRQISVQDACYEQYHRSDVVAVLADPGDPYSWICVVPNPVLGHLPVVKPGPNTTRPGGSGGPNGSDGVVGVGGNPGGGNGFSGLSAGDKAATAGLTSNPGGGAGKSAVGVGVSHVHFGK